MKQKNSKTPINAVLKTMTTDERRSLVERKQRRKRLGANDGMMGWIVKTN